MKRFKFFRQLESLDCAPTCLQMIAYNYGKEIPIEYLRECCKTNKLGTSLRSINTGAKKIELDNVAVSITVEDLSGDLPFPCMLYWQKRHFVILLKIVERKNTFNYFLRKSKQFIVADPAFGILKFESEEFVKMWYAGEKNGIAIFFEPTLNFNNSSNIPNIEVIKRSRQHYLRYFLKLVKEEGWGLFQVFLGTLFSSVLLILFPILTKQLVDTGVKFESYDYITLVLLCQLLLYIVIACIDAVKSWALLHVGTIMDIKLTSNFLKKMMTLPMYYFDSKLTGDLMQRINDNSRIENFVKNYLTDIVTSIVSLVALSILLYSFSSIIFLIFIIGTLMSIGWSYFFLTKRELLDYRKFDVETENTDNLIENIIAMHEIKLNNAEETKRAIWENIQYKMFNINIRILSLQQLQNIGSNTINQIKNIFITYVAAIQVVDGKSTLGTMLGITFILGQLSSPLSQIIKFLQSFQDARISFKRLSDVQIRESEDYSINESEIKYSSEDEIRKVLQNSFYQINFEKVDFSYTDSEDDLLFSNLNLSIPLKKTTAIVGASGSGKTTLIKLLLKFYKPLAGNINLNYVNINSIKSDLWRKNCGVVLQEGHIFSDTILKNISVADEVSIIEKAEHACKLACIHDFIISLPMGYNTMIGSKGIGLSTGQKQRILIARAIYKDPEILFFDEATSSLDAKNERQIIDNLQQFFSGKTVIIVAHRLSTVLNADKIVVIDSGKIVEEGRHDQILENKGIYYNLIKNQLELGK